jgi:hypothetical protein
MSVRALIMAAAGSAVVAFVPTTWNPSDKSSNVTLSGGNLVVTETTASVSGCVRSIAHVTAGKFYWENTITTLVALNVYTFVAVSDSTTGLTASQPAATMISCASNGGHVYAGNTDTGIAFGNFSSGDVYCMALDITAGLLWLRKGAGGLWNASGTANPATGTGGINVSAIVSASKPAFAMVGVFHNGTTGGVTTANFGATAFTGAVPGGFTAGLG